MSSQHYRARYIELIVDEAEQRLTGGEGEARVGDGMVYARLPTGEAVAFDVDEFYDFYVPVLTTSVDLSEGLG